MRGKDKFRRVPPAADGITPAYAGKRKSRRIIGVRLRDHPRLCGEKHHQRAVQSRFQGITPAYAGKSTNKNGGKRNERDHPRLCGEKRTAVQQLVNHEGSPPPMRGKVFQKCPIKIAAGITPAYAGKSTASDALPVFPWDHPRLCGEKEKIAKTSRIDLGSPPPMRGKVQAVDWTELFIRITPAYAGKSLHELGHYLLGEDHPRLCGEKSCTSSRVRSGTGSPPPMRGKVATVLF